SGRGGGRSRSAVGGAVAVVVAVRTHDAVHEGDVEVRAHGVLVCAIVCANVVRRRARVEAVDEVDAVEVIETRVGRSRAVARLGTLCAHVAVSRVIAGAWSRGDGRTARGMNG